MKFGVSSPQPVKTLDGVVGVKATPIGGSGGEFLSIPPPFPLWTNSGPSSSMVSHHGAHPTLATTPTNFRTHSVISSSSTSTMSSPGGGMGREMAANGGPRRTSSLQASDSGKVGLYSFAGEVENKTLTSSSPMGRRLSRTPAKAGRKGTALTTNMIAFASVVFDHETANPSPASPAAAARRRRLPPHRVRTVSTVMSSTSSALSTSSPLLVSHPSRSSSCFDKMEEGGGVDGSTSTSGGGGTGGSMASPASGSAPLYHSGHNSAITTQSFSSYCGSSSSSVNTPLGVPTTTTTTSSTKCRNPFALNALHPPPATVSCFSGGAGAGDIHEPRKGGVNSGSHTAERNGGVVMGKGRGISSLHDSCSKSCSSSRGQGDGDGEEVEEEKGGRADNSGHRQCPSSNSVVLSSIPLSLSPCSSSSSRGLRQIGTSGSRIDRKLSIKKNKNNNKNHFYPSHLGNPQMEKASRIGEGDISMAYLEDDEDEMARGERRHPEEDVFSPTMLINPVENAAAFPAYHSHHDYHHHHTSVDMEAGNSALSTRRSEMISPFLSSLSCNSVEPSLFPLPLPLPPLSLPLLQQEQQLPQPRGGEASSSSSRLVLKNARAAAPIAFRPETPQFSSLSTSSSPFACYPIPLWRKKIERDGLEEKAEEEEEEEQHRKRNCGDNGKNSTSSRKSRPKARTRRSHLQSSDGVIQVANPSMASSTTDLLLLSSLSSSSSLRNFPSTTTTISTSAAAAPPPPSHMHLLRAPQKKEISLLDRALAKKLLPRLPRSLSLQRKEEKNNNSNNKRKEKYFTSRKEAEEQDVEGSEGGGKKKEGTETIKKKNTQTNGKEEKGERLRMAAAVEEMTQEGVVGVDDDAGVSPSRLPSRIPLAMTPADDPPECTSGGGARQRGRQRQPRGGEAAGRLPLPPPPRRSRSIGVKHTQQPCSSSSTAASASLLVVKGRLRMTQFMKDFQEAEGNPSSQHLLIQQLSHWLAKHHHHPPPSSLCCKTTTKPTRLTTTSEESVKSGGGEREKGKGVLAAPSSSCSFSTWFVDQDASEWSMLQEFFLEIIRRVEQSRVEYRIAVWEYCSTHSSTPSSDSLPSLPVPPPEDSGVALRLLALLLHYSPDPLQKPEVLLEVMLLLRSLTEEDEEDDNAEKDDQNEEPQEEEGQEKEMAQKGKGKEDTMGENGFRNKLQNAKEGDEGGKRTGREKMKARMRMNVKLLARDSESLLLLPKPPPGSSSSSITTITNAEGRSSCSSSSKAKSAPSGDMPKGGGGVRQWLEREALFGTLLSILSDERILAYPELMYLILSMMQESTAAAATTAISVKGGSSQPSVRVGKDKSVDASPSISPHITNEEERRESGDMYDTNSAMPADDPESGASFPSSSFAFPNSPSQESSPHRSPNRDHLSASQRGRKKTQDAPKENQSKKLKMKLKNHRMRSVSPSRMAKNMTRTTAIFSSPSSIPDQLVGLGIIPTITAVARFILEKIEEQQEEEVAGKKTEMEKGGSRNSSDANRHTLGNPSGSPPPHNPNAKSTSSTMSLSSSSPRPSSSLVSSTFSSSLSSSSEWRTEIIAQICLIYRNLSMSYAMCLYQSHVLDLLVLILYIFRHVHFVLEAAARALAKLVFHPTCLASLADNPNFMRAALQAMMTQLHCSSSGQGEEKGDEGKGGDREGAEEEENHQQCQLLVARLAGTMARVAEQSEDQRDLLARHGTGLLLLLMKRYVCLDPFPCLLLRLSSTHSRVSLPSSSSVSSSASLPAVVPATDGHSPQDSLGEGHHHQNHNRDEEDTDSLTASQRRLESMSLGSTSTTPTTSAGFPSRRFSPPSAFPEEEGRTVMVVAGGGGGRECEKGVKGWSLSSTSTTTTATPTTAGGTTPSPPSTLALMPITAPPSLYPGDTTMMRTEGGNAKSMEYQQHEQEQEEELGETKKEMYKLEGRGEEKVKKHLHIDPLELTIQSVAEATLTAGSSPTRRRDPAAAMIPSTTAATLLRPFTGREVGSRKGKFGFESDLGPHEKRRGNKKNGWEGLVEEKEKKKLRKIERENEERKEGKGGNQSEGGSTSLSHAEGQPTKVQSAQEEEQEGPYPLFSLSYTHNLPLIQSVVWLVGVAAMSPFCSLEVVLQGVPSMTRLLQDIVEVTSLPVRSYSTTTTTSISATATGDDKGDSGRGRRREEAKGGGGGGESFLWDAQKKAHFTALTRPTLLYSLMAISNLSFFFGSIEERSQGHGEMEVRAEHDNNNNDEEGEEEKGFKKKNKELFVSSSASSSMASSSTQESCNNNSRSPSYHQDNNGSHRRSSAGDLVKRLRALYEPLGLTSAGLLFSGDTEASVEATRIISNICFTPSGADWVEEHRLDEVLVLFMGHEDRRIVYNCAGALLNLTAGMTCRVVEEPELLSMLLKYTKDWTCASTNNRDDGGGEENDVEGGVNLLKKKKVHSHPENESPPSSQRTVVVAEKSYREQIGSVVEGLLHNIAGLLQINQTEEE